jgi:hypothetical protein
MAASAAASKGLMRVLATPAKVASSLDWRKAGGAILTLTIHTDRIEMALSHHPSTGRPSQTLAPLPLGRKGRVVPEESRRLLSDVVKQQRVCAFVASWPLQPDNGKMGYAAGRTLWMIEQLAEDGSTLSANRPVCLWDGIRAEHSSTDLWGRNPDFARTSQKSLHSASKEQYHADEATVASQVWDDFMKANWPNIYYNSLPNAQELQAQEEEEQEEQYILFHARDVDPTETTEQRMKA